MQAKSSRWCFRDDRGTGGASGQAPVASRRILESQQRQALRYRLHLGVLLPTRPDPIGLCSAGGGWQTVPEKTQADTDFLTCKREKGNNRADSCNRGLAVSQIPGLALPAPISSVQDHFSKFLQWRPSFSIRSSASFGPHVPAA